VTVAPAALGVLQVSTYDVIGGAERVAWNLFQTYRRRGHPSWLAVGTKLGTDPGVLLIPNRANHGAPAVVARPAKAVERFCGIEDFRFPGTRRLVDMTTPRPDVVHCHNLHGGYFDLRALPWLSGQVPVVMTLHDAWLLSGHCAHSFECERWKIGCGHCPDLTIDPAIRRDATAYNWRRKAKIFAGSRLWVATPSRWLMRKVEQSMLARAIVEARVIPNGVDLTVFHPADKEAARSRLGIPARALVVLFAATAVRENIWKDYRTVREGVSLAVARLQGQDIMFVALGQDAPEERIGPAVLRFVPYQTEPRVVAGYYQASDVYVHGARADTFPNTVLEAQACGIPTVATAVGGIPEQIEDGRNGFLVSVGDAAALAERLIRLLSDQPLRHRMGAQGAEDTRSRFDLNGQADAYLDWYQAAAQRHAATRLARSG
jgi:glycosyltransferase involved in cell wall biosynthesis